ncbi:MULTISPECIES: hypothetical protein [Methanobacterium]|nr:MULTISPECIES: hypothetical protein [Methanobacterium]
MPTSCLDVTSDINIALFFALNKFSSDKQCYEPLNINECNDAVIYLFAEALNYKGNDGTRIRSSEDIINFFGSANLSVPLRIKRQKCGLLYGSSYYGINYYLDLLIGKIVLKDFNELFKTPQQDFLFPSGKDDEIFRLLEMYKPELPYLMKYKPKNKFTNRKQLEIYL